MSAIYDLDQAERLVWRVLSELEGLALRSYRRHELALPLAGKQSVVDQLAQGAGDRHDLEKSVLAGPVDRLLEAAKDRDATSTLLIQGLLLERLGQLIYAVLAESPSATNVTREMATKGKAAAEDILEQVPAIIKDTLGVGDALFQQFCTRTRDVFAQLDTLGDGVDEVFGERFGIHYADLMGDFIAELLPTLVDLGMKRRKVVCHLAGALMSV